MARNWRWGAGGHADLRHPAFSNFAHGDTMAFGTMVTILATWGLQAMGVSFGPLPTALLALPIGIAVTALLLLGTDRRSIGSIARSGRRL